ncbi:XdhC family protein [Pseudomonas sp. NPDC007930]|uniref:XdhC family protein n=1 Tax=Pseudomonas sp. NPDC007930 TaxID=3364417 RepID=UPI0036E62A95
MMHLDRQVVEQALAWLEAGQPAWLCTVLASYGSAPRPPGSMLVARADGQHLGSLSGGCVEEDFLQRLGDGQFSSGARIIRYGEGGLAPTLALPCGGVLEVLVEALAPSTAACDHLRGVGHALAGQRPCVRQVRLADGALALLAEQACAERVRVGAEQVAVRIGPSRRLLIAGLSPVAEHCIALGLMLGHDVQVYDPREELLLPAQARWAGPRWQALLPARAIAEGACHAATAVIALTHDPRMDDLTLLEALRTEAFYIGAMGSQRTSERRRERLGRIGGLQRGDLARLHAPVGLALGSKTPAEIALAVMADIVRVANGVERSRL